MLGSLTSFVSNFCYAEIMRASRLLSILSRLQRRGVATAQSLADAHEVSVRTIYRDIDALSAAGFPVYGDSGPGGGFRLLDVATTRLTGLAPAETEAMLLIGMPGAAAAMGLGRATDAARDKLLLGLTGSARQAAERVEERLHIDPADWYRAAEVASHLPAVARAVIDQRWLVMRYQSWSGERDWRVAPLGIVLKGGDWYLVARQHLQESSRRQSRILTFRISAIGELSVEQEECPRPDGFDLPRWWAASLAGFEARLRPFRATLLLTATGAKRLSEQGSYAAAAVADGKAVTRNGLSWIEAVLPFESDDQAARLVLSLGAEARVLSPPELIDELARMARAVLAMHQPTAA
mgnify:CR=1 FL=1